MDIGGHNPPAFKLETMSACQLITYVYEAKVLHNVACNRVLIFNIFNYGHFQLKDGLENLSNIDFTECQPLLSYAKDVSSVLFPSAVYLNFPC